jgi:hypothetical protein
MRAACPSLETLRIRGSSEVKLGPIVAPNLKSFTVETGGLRKAVLDCLS